MLKARRTPQLAHAEPISIAECRRILGTAFTGTDDELRQIRDAMQPMAEMVAAIILSELRGEVAAELTAIRPPAQPNSNYVN